MPGVTKVGSSAGLRTTRRGVRSGRCQEAGLERPKPLEREQISILVAAKVAVCHRGPGSGRRFEARRWLRLRTETFADPILQPANRVRFNVTQRLPLRFGQHDRQGAGHFVRVQLAHGRQSTISSATCRAEVSHGLHAPTLWRAHHASAWALSASRMTSGPGPKRLGWHCGVKRES
jgi:hypothetical protein